MSSITISNKAVVRTALLPTNINFESAWLELKHAIKESSPDFYNIIKELSASDIGGQPQSVQITIDKYFNRARFRATPYGRFGSFSPVIISQNDPQFVIDPSITEHHFASWEQIAGSEVQQPSLLSFLQLNATCYEVGNTLRYIARTENGFELMEYNLNDDIKEIINACKYGIKTMDLYRELYGKLEKDVLENVIELNRAGILFSDQQPGIIGMQYPIRKDILKTKNDKTYLISERQVLEGGPGKQIFRHLPKAIEMLAKVIPAPASSDMKDFRINFQKRFEGRFLPLALALDPEMGVDYAGLSHIEAEPLFSELFGSDEGTKKEEDFKQAIRDHLLSGSYTSSDSIDLKDIVMKDWSADAELPNTMNLLVTISGDKVYLEQAGGCTATAIPGRFTLASDKVVKQCREMAQIEEQANPEILFFDIAYMDEVHVDNINRRQQIYEHQLAILNFNEASVPLILSDIYVGIENDLVVLWSKKFNRRLVPRLSSAYNFSRSSLPVFRFLCDLQFEGIHARPFFKIESIFPKHNYFPEIRYKNVILSKRKWRIRSHDINNLVTSVFTCRKGFDDLGVSQYFTCGIEDQRLLFDRNSIKDVELFIHWARAKTELIIEEAPVPGDTGVMDKAGNNYSCEYVLYAFHHQEVYKPISVSDDSFAQLPGKYSPGSVWTYLEIYCHPGRANQLLTENLIPTIKGLSYLVDKWFFIRYDEGGHHIRFRAKAHEQMESHKIQERLIASIDQELELGIVSDVMVRVYKPEYHRYSFRLMDKVERHFCIDSTFVLAILNEPLPTTAIYRLCTKTALKVVSSGIIGKDSFEKLTAAVLRSFEREHMAGPVQFRNMNAIFREYRNSKSVSLTGGQEKASEQFTLSFMATLLEAEVENRSKLFVDLMHMHFNRLFPERQRTYEMAWYYVMHKELLRKKALIAGIVTVG